MTVHFHFRQKTGLCLIPDRAISSLLERGRGGFDSAQPQRRLVGAVEPTWRRSAIFAKTSDKPPELKYTENAIPLRNTYFYC